MKRLLGRKGDGRLPSLGQDFRAGHEEYVTRLGAEAQLWLRTKPFSVPPGHELRECLRTFAHIVEHVELGVRAQVLDVGCGPGWLSEFLARCGYWVTGVDVSEDMVQIARDRIASIREPIGDGIEAVAEFHAMPVLELPWQGRFDAAILYDAMHHFDDEVKTLRVIRHSLVPGGLVFIHEGVRPDPGSPGERTLVEEMEEYGTLESPFEPEYLEAVLRKAGFTSVQRFAAVDELVDLSALEPELQRVESRIRTPPMNTVLAANPASGVGSAFAAQLRPKGAWQIEGEQLSLKLEVTNVGRGYWPGGETSSSPRGVVRIGPYVPIGAAERVELPRTALPRSLAHGDSTELEIRIPGAEVQGRSEVTIDLVREGLAWFEDYGSTPLVVPLPDGD